MPERSHWAWGWAHKFPDREGRENLGQMASAMLGLQPHAVKDPVAEGDATLAPASETSPPESLRAILSDARPDRLRQTYGRAYPDIVRGFYGDFQGAPDLVARPESAEDVARVLDWASDARVAVIPRGGGTSVVGGVNSAEVEGDFDAILSLDLTGMNRVTQIDRESLSAHIQAGALGPEIEDQLRPHGLTLRHFPQSFEFSTLGGWLATRAGGHFATLYTHIDDLTQSMRLVTPAGEIASRRLPGSGAGPSPDRMFLGSEGSLGVITDAWMRIRERPRWVGKADLFFDTFEQVTAAARVISQSSLYPTNCRVLDAREAMLNQVTMDGRHVLLLGFESAHAPVADRLAQAIDLAKGEGGDCPRGARLQDRKATQREGDGESAAGQWRDAFFEGPYLQSTLISIGLLADTFETCCLWSNFEAMHADIIRSMRQVMREVCGKTGLISCRFTHVYPDGPAPYYTYVVEARPGDEIAQWRAIKQAASEVLMRHEATITHHHAVGRTHHPYWATSQRPELFGRALRAVKRELDPSGILNPGVIAAP